MSERGHFSQTQRDILLQPIASWRIQYLDGQSHVAGWDAIAHLNRVFGFEGWDKEILSLELVYENVGEREVNQRGGGKKKVMACSVGYRCTLRLTIRDTEGNVIRVIEDAAMGTATNQRDLGDAHDLAVKSAVTYALKRCAKDLGDQFGLSLYNKGQETAVVGKVAVYGHDVAEHEGVVEADGISEGDSGFGSNREGDAPDGDLGPQGEEIPPTPPPVREPTPAAPKDDKPEATAPEPKVEVAPISEEETQTWLDTIAGVPNVDALKEVWKSIAKSGHLDILVTVDDAPVTLREVMVKRVREFEEAA